MPDSGSLDCEQLLAVINSASCKLQVVFVCLVINEGDDSTYLSHDE